MMNQSASSGTFLSRVFGLVFGGLGFCWVIYFCSLAGQGRRVTAVVDYKSDPVDLNTQLLAAPISTSSSNDHIILETSANTINTVDGGAGDDILIGGMGADTLVGGRGDGHLTGGQGKQ